MTRPFWAGKPNETDLRIELISGSTICVCGADNFDSLRGDGLKFLVMDEYASIAREAWTEVLRPALADKQGRALFIGTPLGRNHFHEIVERAETLPDWKVFYFTTAEGGNVAPEELVSAAQEMDERSFLQEFEGRFENLSVGRAYYAFDRIHNVGNLGYDSRVPLSWAIDFNINPHCSVLAQIHGGRVFILDEMILPHSNTLEACEEFVRRTQKWSDSFPLIIHVCGDATGEQGRTSALRTDWQIVRDFFGRYTDRYNASFRVPKANPPVRERVNCVNALLRNHAGAHRMMVVPSCKDLIKDFEQVCWKTDPHGNTLAALDKSDPKRTHISDAVGYLIARDFSMRPPRGEMGGPAIC